MPCEGAPQSAFLLGAVSPLGRSQPFVLPAHTIAHIRNRHGADGLAPAEIARIPDALKSPRAVMFDKDCDGFALLPAVESKDRPLALSFKKDELISGRNSVRITRIQTLFGASDPLKMIAAEMKKGSRVWLPSEDLQRARGLIEDINRPSMGSPAIAPPRTTPTVDGQAFRKPAATNNMLSDEALVKFRARRQGLVSCHPNARSAR